MHFFFHISYFLKTTVNTLIEDILIYNMILCDLCYREPIISKIPFSLRGAVMPQATLCSYRQQQDTRTANITFISATTGHTYCKHYVHISHNRTHILQTLCSYQPQQDTHTANIMFISATRGHTYCKHYVHISNKRTRTIQSLCSYQQQHDTHTANDYVHISNKRTRTIQSLCSYQQQHDTHTANDYVHISNKRTRTIQSLCSYQQQHDTHTANDYVHISNNRPRILQTTMFIPATTGHTYCKHYVHIRNNSTHIVVERRPAPWRGFRGECCPPTTLHRLCGQRNDKMSTCRRCQPFVNRIRRREHSELREVWWWWAIMREQTVMLCWDRPTRWRRHPVNSDGQAASRREQWTRSPEC